METKIIFISKAYIIQTHWKHTVLYFFILTSDIFLNFLKINVFWTLKIMQPLGRINILRKIIYFGKIRQWLIGHRATGYILLNDIKVCFYWKLQTVLQNFFCKWSIYSPVSNLAGKWAKILCLHCILIYFKQPFVRLGEVVLQDKSHPNNAVQETKGNTNTVLKITYSGLHRASSSSTWVTESFNP